MPMKPSERERWTCGLPAERRVEVEQAIALGRSLDWITDRLGVSTQIVDAVLARMDACNEEADCDIEPCGTHAAFNRHKAAKEPPCSRCKYAESAWQAERHRRRKFEARKKVA